MTRGDAALKGMAATTTCTWGYVSDCVSKKSSSDRLRSETALWAELDAGDGTRIETKSMRGTNLDAEMGPILSQRESSHPRFSLV